jgi:uncharacterized protein YkwD
MQFSMHIRVGLSVLFVAVLVAPAAHATTLNPSERALLSAVNEVRATNRLRPLKLDTTLVRAARDYSATLIRRDIFTHGSLAPR